MEVSSSKLKVILASWRDAVKAHEDGRYQDAIDAYRDVPETSARICYNIACACMKLGEDKLAIQHLSEAIKIDGHLAIAYFQRGALHMLSYSPENAAKDFDSAYTLMRGNNHIDYKPLGLFAILLMSEVQYNRSMASLQGGDVTKARSLLREALYCADKVRAEQLRSALHFMEDLKPEMATPLQKSTDRVFCPPKNVTDNLERQQKVVKAKVVASNSNSLVDPIPRAEKRVQELLLLAKTQQSSPTSTLSRFLKSPTRPRSKSSVDISTIDMPTSPVLLRLKDKGQNRNRSKSSADISVKTDESKSPPILLRLKDNIFQKGQKRNRSKSSADIRASAELVTKPVLRKIKFGKNRKNRSTPNLQHFHEDGTMSGPSSAELSPDKLTPTSPTKGFNILSYTPGNEEINMSNSKENSCKSLGRTFGCKSTAVKKGLTLSCDVFTAFVTPCSDDEASNSSSDVSADKFTELSISVPHSRSSIASQEGVVSDWGAASDGGVASNLDVASDVGRVSDDRDRVLRRASRTTQVSVVNGKIVINEDDDVVFKRTSSVTASENSSVGMNTGNVHDFNQETEWCLGESSTETEDETESENSSVSGDINRTYLRSTSMNNVTMVTKPDPQTQFSRSNSDGSTRASSSESLQSGFMGTKRKRQAPTPPSEQTHEEALARPSSVDIEALYKSSGTVAITRRQNSRPPPPSYPAPQLNLIKENQVLYA